MCLLTIVRLSWWCLQTQRSSQKKFLSSFYFRRNHKSFYNNNEVFFDVNKLWYFKFPYIDKHSEQVQKEITKLCKQNCKENNVKTVFNSLKISNSFSLKDGTLCFLRSFLVYTFICARCKFCYTGKTCHHFINRIDEHIKKDKKSNVFHQLHSKEECFLSFDLNYFSIWDLATTSYQALKDGIHIYWEKPNLNKQKKISVYYLINLINFYGFYFLSSHLWIYNNNFNCFYLV